MAIGPVGHPRKKKIRFVAAAAVAISDPRWPPNSGPAPTVLSALLLDQHGHAWWWDGVTERGARIRMGAQPDGSPPASVTIPTRRRK